MSAAAPAKINLVLEVLGRREDGYHTIDTVLQTLELADTVTVQTGAAAPGMTVSGEYAAGTPADAENLAWRAATHLAATLGRDVDGVAIHLEKRIPPAGGLGGGASDAATVLRLLQRAWPEATEAHLLDAATAVGSDEAFFLMGGTARAEGRGERVTPLPDLPARDVVLFVPPSTIERKTASMFAALAGHPFDDGSATAAFVRDTGGAFDAANVFNAFERVAFVVFGGLANLWERLEGATGQPIRLAGAGPTLFWIGPEGGGARVVERAAGADCEIIVTRTARSLWRR